MSTSIYDEVQSFKDSHEFFSKGIPYLWEEFSDEFFSNYMKDVEINRALTKYTEAEVSTKTKNYTYRIFGLINAMAIIFMNI